MRTRPASITVNALRSRGPSFATASTTVAGLARRARPSNLTRITPAEDRPRIYQFAEVPILRDKHALLIQSALQNLLVRRASRDFGNRNHIMSRLT